MSRKSKPPVEFPPSGKFHFDVSTGMCDSDGLTDVVLHAHTTCEHGLQTLARYIPCDPQLLGAMRARLRKHRGGRRQ